MRTHSIRIPIHGFVEFSDWERDIINHSVFQRLRRIRQLAFAEHIYPGSTHTRFEHSLGVMHIATRMFKTLQHKHDAMLRDRFRFDTESFNRAECIVRLAALLHDVGHGPCSHSAEEVMPISKNGKRYQHEDYTAALIRDEMRDVINDHTENRERLNITASEIADFYLGKGKAAISEKHLLWRDLVNGQLDADRMDYLLRDSYHCGVSYGQYDLDRIIDTLTFIQDQGCDSSEEIRIGVEQGGMHAAEGLILARYFMFTQVYFHPVRLAYDRHVSKSLTLKLTNKSSSPGVLPEPSTPSGRNKYLKLDDWDLQTFIHQGKAKHHGEAITKHQHDRCVYKTGEVPKASELEEYEARREKLADNNLDVWSTDAEKSWYKVDATEIQIANKNTLKKQPFPGKPLSEHSDLVRKIPPIEQYLMFVPKAQYDDAMDIIKQGEPNVTTK